MTEAITAIGLIAAATISGVAALFAAKADAKLTAQAKLAALGLTGEEIAALSN